MPIYEYVCSSCGQEKEVMAKVNDPAPASCSHCNESGTLSKKISLGSFKLEGGGWYKEGYSGGSSNSSSGSSKAAAPCATGTCPVAGS